MLMIPLVDFYSEDVTIPMGEHVPVRPSQYKAPDCRSKEVWMAHLLGLLCKEELAKEDVVTWVGYHSQMV